jgi:hypothetical protein
VHLVRIGDRHAIGLWGCFPEGRSGRGCLSRSARRQRHALSHSGPVLRMGCRMPAQLGHLPRRRLVHRAPGLSARYECWIRLGGSAYARESGSSSRMMSATVTLRRSTCSRSVFSVFHQLPRERAALAMGYHRSAARSERAMSGSCARDLEDRARRTECRRTVLAYLPSHRATRRARDSPSSRHRGSRSSTPNSG